MGQGAARRIRRVQNIPIPDSPGVDPCGGWRRRPTEHRPIQARLFVADVRTIRCVVRTEHRPNRSCPSCVSHPSTTAPRFSGDRRRGRSVENAQPPVVVRGGRRPDRGGRRLGGTSPFSISGWAVSRCGGAAVPSDRASPSNAPLSSLPRVLIVGRGACSLGVFETRLGLHLRWIWKTRRVALNDALA